MFWLWGYLSPKMVKYPFTGLLHKKTHGRKLQRKRWFR
nr:MAG TPA: hypothetical protein [Caudoviricetes sp.]